MKVRRKEIGMSAEQVAEQLKISPSTVYRYENGDIGRMGIDKLTPIAAALQCTPAYLMGWDDDQQPSTSRIGSFGGILRKLRSKAGISQGELSKFIGTSKSSVNMYERGEREPNFETLGIIADFFNVDTDYLLGRESTAPSEKPLFPYSIGAMQLARDYDCLDTWGQKAVRELVDTERARCSERARSELPDTSSEIIYFNLPQYHQRMSAGTGQPAGDEWGENLLLTKRPPQGASYVATISGDSMEPTYHDGDSLFIQATVDIQPGQVGVFLMDGQQWIKELGDGVLISHNPAYPPRPLTEDVRCQGLVLGVCDDSYFA